MKINRVGWQPSYKGPEETFTGAVRVDRLFEPQDPSPLGGALVTFEPGARTAWHRHPLGQTLIITAGWGRVQAEGGPVCEVRPGDVVCIAAGERHWHGASPTMGMSHIALQERVGDQMVEWLEKVSDEEYGAGV